MKNDSGCRLFFSRLTCLLLSGVALQSLKAQTYDWVTDGSSTYNWGDSVNWNPNTGFPNAVGAVANIYKDFTIGSSFAVGLGVQPTVGTLKLGDTGSSPTLIRFTAGGAAAALNLQVTSGTAAINKLTSNEADFRKRVNFVSNTTVSVTGGILRWSQVSTNLGSLGGNGNISFEGAGGVTIFDATAVTDFATNYGGNITVQNAGTLLVNNTLNAFSSARTVTVANTGRLGGSGTVARATTVNSGGILAPGNSAGVLTFSNGLTLDANSNFNFELTGNTSSGRGTAFDGVNLTGGNLTIAAGADFNLAFNAAGSTVNFANGFWDANQSWLIFQNGALPTVSGGIFDLGTVSVDSVGAAFSTTGGSLAFATVGNDVYLTYTVPEPSTCAVIAAAAVGTLVVRRRRNFVRE